MGLLLGVGVIIVAAYFLGITAANGARTWKAKQERVRQTETVLKQMGTGLRPGKTLPDAVLADLEGYDIRLSDILCDRTVIVFFKPDCSFSRAELAAIKEATVKPEDQACFVLISGADQPELWAIKEELGLSCPLLFDRNTQYGKVLGIKSVPLNFIVDRNLQIEEVVSGAMPSRDIAEIMKNSRRR